MSTCKTKISTKLKRARNLVSVLLQFIRSVNFTPAGAHMKKNKARVKHIKKKTGLGKLDCIIKARKPKWLKHVRE